MRAKPGTSLHMFNAQLMCQNNGTEAFMENFDEADHAHLRQVARELDASGLENQRQAKLTEYAQKKTDETMEEVNKVKQKKADNVTRLAAVELIFDQTIIEKTKGKKLQDQLDALYQAGAPLPLKKFITKADEKRDAIKALIASYSFVDGNWISKTAVNDDLGTGGIQNDEGVQSDEEE